MTLLISRKFQWRNAFWGRYNLLVSKCETIFDINASDERSKRQEIIWGVKMLQEDHAFYLNQCKVHQVGHCSSFVSRKWRTSHKKKVEKEERECSAKPWNRENHFNAFIAPKNNFSLTLKDHRFNRLFDCCTTLLYHLDDIKSYLEKYASVLNSIAILDRGFLEITILKPIFCATALIGFHVARPFLRLVLNTETTYDVLLVAFPRLYNELSTTDTKSILQVEKQVFHFVSKSLFEESMPEKCLKDALVECMKNIQRKYSSYWTLLFPA